MDNRNDVEYLLSAEGREAIINSHIQGIVVYSTSPIISDTGGMYEYQRFVERQAQVGLHLLNPFLSIFAKEEIRW